MARYKRKPLTVEAVRWFKNGDHPRDNCRLIDDIVKEGDTPGPPFLSEGQVVRRFNLPGYHHDSHCGTCGWTWQAHGWLDTKSNYSGNIVCPGDYIVTDGEEGQEDAFGHNDFCRLFEPA